MSKPTLTVCLITYNQKQYIHKAIDTILAQDINVPWELVIADDYSTDGTRQILQDYEEKHPELIKLILQKSNVGPEKNWLDLMAYPKSRYVLYAEGDDYFTDTTKLQRQIDFLEANKDCSICFHPVKIIYDDASKPEEIFPTPDFRFNAQKNGLKELLSRNFMQTNSVMYKWRFIDDNIKDIFPLGIAPGDWFLHLLHAEVGKIGFLDRVMSVYRRHSAAIWLETHDKFWAKYGIMHLNTYEEQLKLFGNDPSYQQIIHQTISNTIITLSKLESAGEINILNEAINKFPDSTKITIEYLIKQLEDTRQSTLQEVEALDDHSKAQAKIIEHYKELNKRLEAENDRIMPKILIKLEYVLKNRIKGKNNNQSGEAK